MKMDDLNKRLLVLLARNGRMSVADLARLVEANVSTVRYRVNKLMQEQIITFIGEISYEQFGYQVLAHGRCRVDRKVQDQVARMISGFPEVSYLATSFGEDNIMFEIIAKSTKALDEFISGKLAQVPGVEMINVSVTPKVYKTGPQWLPSELLTAIEGIEKPEP
jgi:Lrp/AsnC family transcriptional regulator for asnA, asnC and gidA